MNNKDIELEKLHEENKINIINDKIIINKVADLLDFEKAKNSTVFHLIGYLYTCLKDVDRKYLGKWLESLDKEDVNCKESNKI